MKRWFALLCFSFGVLPLAARQPTQTPLSDSLTARLAAAPADTNRVLLLDQLAAELRTTNSPLAVGYGKQGLQLARQLRYVKGQVLLLNQLGSVYFAREDLAQAAVYYQQAVRRAGRVPSVGRPLTLALLGLGRVAVMQHDYAEGQRYFRQALGRIQQRRYPVLPKDMGIVQNNLGILYFDWATSGQAYPDSVRRLCLHYNRLALNTIRRDTSTASLAVCLNGVGQAHRVNKRYDSTEYYHRAALALFRRLNSPYDVAETQGWLGNALVAQGRAPEAVPVLRAALATANQLQLPALQADCSLHLAAALAATGRGGAAYQLARQGQALLDSLRAADQRADVARLRVAFDTEQERSRVSQLTHRNQLQALQARRQHQYLWGLASFLLAVVVGLVVAWVLAVRLRRERAELRVARAEQDQLYALIAHDLRSPVVAFSGLADLLTAYSARQDTARLLSLGGRVRQAAESLREMLDNLLNWALSQRGELRAAPVPMQVGDLLAEITRTYHLSAQNAGVDLLVPAAPSEYVLADRNMTLTILRNLLSNALQATAGGGQISLGVTVGDAQGAWLQLEVTDSGQGMSPQELAWAMSDPVTYAPDRGRARLGLRLSRLFARQQGGTLLLSSVQGQGTTATLCLPRVAAPTA